MNKEKSDFTQGSILKKLIPFMIPILGKYVIIRICQQLYFSDTLFS